jgi:transcriptional regulator with XRE-family HTH domain
VRQLAADANMNLTRLADATGIDRSALTNIANDKLGLGPKRAQQIADALGVDVSEVRLPKAEAVTLASADRRLQALADDLAAAVEGQAKLAREVARLRARVARLEARPLPGPNAATG